MTGLDPATLIGLMSGDPADRQTQVQQLLLQSLTGSGGLPGDATSAEPARGNAEDALRRLQNEVSFVESEFRRVSTMLAQVGAALGACPRCLGTDAGCPVCVGAGNPGSEDPDVERFNALIAPAVRRLAEGVGITNPG